LQAAIIGAVNLWLANLLGENGYGILGLGLVVATLQSAFVSFGSDTTLVRDLTHTKAPDDILLASVALRGVVAVLAMTGCIAWLVFDSSMTDVFLPVLLCAIAGVTTGLSPKGWFDSRYQMNQHAGLMCLEKALYGMSLLFLFSTGILEASPTAVASCFLIARLIGFSAQWAFAWKTWAPSINQLWRNMLWLLRENRWVFGATIGNMAAPHINQVVLANQQGRDDLAHFFIIFQFVAIVQLLQQLYVRLLMPRIAEVTREGSPVTLIRSQLLRFMQYSLFVNAIVIVPIFIVGPALIEYLLPPEFLAGVGSLRILLIWSAVDGLGLVANQFLICLRLDKHFFSLAISKGLLAIFLGQILIPRYGGNGVALTLVFCSVVFMVLRFGILWRKINALR